MDKTHMFWGKMKFKGPDHDDVPRVTYRCKTKRVEREGHTHLCKKVADHPGDCVCVCDAVVREVAP